MKQLPIWKKSLFGAVTTLAFIGTLEIVLAVIGVQVKSKTEDPWVGFSSYAPLLTQRTNQNGESVLVTADNKLTWFNRIEFKRKKADNTYRIVCLGGSTTYGHPFWDVTSYSRWLREFLPTIDGSKKWEVINAGGISYASYRVANVMEELSQYEPDLFIVFSAHNEFLERRTYHAMFDRSSIVYSFSGLLSKTRTWWLVKSLIDRITKAKTMAKSEAAVNVANTNGNLPLSTKAILPTEVDEMLNHSIGPIDYHRDPEWKESVIRHYRSNLERMLSIARSSGAKIVFVAPASNEKDCSPFKSEPNPQLKEEESLRFQTILKNAKQASTEADNTKTQVAYEACLAIDPEYPEANYRLGKLLFAAEQFDRADGFFQQAIDSDVCALRAVSDIVNTIREVAVTKQVPIVDFDKRLHDRCRSEHGHACLGNEYFLDHVHPTVDVHRQLALWIIETLQEEAIVAGDPVSDVAFSDRFNAISELIESELTGLTQGIAFRNLAKTMHWAGRYEESAPHARDALEYLIEDSESRFVLADSLKNLGQISDALDHYAILMKLDPEYDRAYHPYGELLAQNGDWSEAKIYLLLAHVRKPENAGVLYWLGMAHLELKEFSFAVEAFEKSDELFPNDPSILFCLAQSKAAVGDKTGASAILKKLIELGFDSPEVQAELNSLAK
jgi:tetratricopeptide (TPR) repeat protein